MKAARIGLLSHETSTFKPFLGVNSDNEGGLILYPGTYVGDTRWNHGVVELGVGGDANLGSQIRPDSTATTEQVPKMHYHRSGWLSANVTDASPHIGLKCTPLDRLRGVHTFTYIVDRPDLLATSETHRTGDIMQVPHGRWPGAVAMAVFVYGRDQVPGLDGLFQATPNRPFGFVQNDKAVAVVDLAGHGIDAAIALKFSYARSSRNSRVAQAAVALFGFDQRVSEPQGISDILGVWTTGYQWPEVPLVPKTNYPFARRAWPTPSPDIGKIRRAIGGTIESREPFTRDR